MSRFPALVLVLLATLLAACGGAPVATQPPEEEVTTAVSPVPPGSGDISTATPGVPDLGPTATPPASRGVDVTPAAAGTTDPSATPTGPSSATPTAPAGTAEPAETAGSAAGGFPLTYTDAGGTAVTLEERPERVISLFATNNDTLFAIGARDQIVAVDDFTARSREAGNLPTVGGNNFEFNVERMVALRPDLVLTSFGTAELVDEPLRDAGIAVIATPYPTSLADTYTLMRDLGRITGHTAAAEREVNRLRRTVQDVRVRAGQAPAVRTYFETDASDPAKPFVAGPGTLTNEVIEVAGGRNLFADVESGQVGLEAIVRADPQVILLGNAEGSVPPLFLNPVTIRDVRAREGFRSIAAVRDGRIVPINPDRLVPGPRLNQGIRDVAVALHPEVFGER